MPGLERSNLPPLDEVSNQPEAGLTPVPPASEENSVEENSVEEDPEP